MIKKVFLYFFLILSLNSKAQNWTPLDTGIHSFIPYGLISDKANNNLYAFGNKFTIKGLDVWKNNKWELWYPNIELSTYGENRSKYDSVMLYFKNYYEGNDISMPRTAIIQFTDSMDLDTIKIYNNHDWYPSKNCIYNGKLIVFSNNSNPSGLNSIATFDGDTIIPIGNASIAQAGIYMACVYKGELYAGGYLNSAGSIRGIMKLTPTGWQTIYQMQGSLSSMVNMIVYNNRLYIYGGLYLAESSANLGNNIIAYDGINFDTIGGGVINEFNSTNGGVNDAVVCNNKLFVTGNFSKAGGATAKGFAYWNDTTWCTTYRDLDSTGNFFRLECFQDTIYEVAEFYKMYGQNIGWLAKLNNCNLTDTCSASYFVGLKENSISNNINIYPNPTTSILNITDEQNQLQNATITITNYLGQVVFTSYFTSQIHLHNLSAGMYFLTVEDKSSKKTVKVIKQ